jgi:excinuclease ABC subunit B
MTDSIKKFLAVTEYRRQKQIIYNTEHNITPRSVSRAVEESLVVREETRGQAAGVLRDAGMDVDITETIKELEEEMLSAANNLEFEKAALMRDQIKELKLAIDGSQPAKEAKAKPVSYRQGKRSSSRRTNAPF